MVAGLSGCVSFGSKPPKSLLSLSADNKVAVGASRTAAKGKSITVGDPETPKSLDTVRIPIQVTPTSVAYLTGTQWVDTPRHLFRKLLSETIAASGDMIVLDPGQYSADPGRRLLGELVDFGVDAGSRTAIVTYDATLASADGSAITRRRFSASVPVGQIDAATVGDPLNRAANKVAADVAAWVAQN
ncbi:ABC-type transport auxiliary lipoprotein family protein [Sphingobium sp. H39-3-25]|nr:ABC-type transport auxiliary lipoprotein family protein [Sphingobium arseniciresistens]